MYETPIQKTNPKRKHKIKKQLFEKNKTVWKPIYLCEESQV